MNKKVIAVVGLNRGYTAFYDPKSRIILDLSRPMAPVFEGTDVSGLKQAIGNTLYLVSGSLTANTEAVADKQQEVNINSNTIIATSEKTIEEEKVKETEVEDADSEKKEDAADSSENITKKKKKK